MCRWTRAMRTTDGKWYSIKLNTFLAFQSSWRELDAFTFASLIRRYASRSEKNAIFSANQKCCPQILSDSSSISITRVQWILVYKSLLLVSQLREKKKRQTAQPALSKPQIKSWEISTEIKLLSGPSKKKQEKINVNTVLKEINIARQLSRLFVPWLLFVRTNYRPINQIRS